MLSHTAPPSCARRVRRAATARFLATALTALVLALAVTVTGASAQSATTVTGIVVSDSGAPLSGAVVRILWSDSNGKLVDRTVRSDDQGAFRVEKLAAGNYAFTVQRDGFEPYDAPFTLEKGAAGAQLLAELVTAAPSAAGATGRADETTSRIGVQQNRQRSIERRRGGSAAQYISREDIDRRHPRLLTDVLRSLPGTFLGGEEQGERGIIFRDGSLNSCRPDVYVDGAPLGSSSIDTLQPAEVDGIEIYRRLSQLPANLRANGATCAIVIWTRDSAGR